MFIVRRLILRRKERFTLNGEGNFGFRIANFELAFTITWDLQAKTNKCARAKSEIRNPKFAHAQSSFQTDKSLVPVNGGWL